MPHWLYTLALRVLWVPAALVMLWRAWRAAGTGGTQVSDAWRGRLFPAAAKLTSRPLWLHAASMGEVQALAALVRALRARSPALPLLITAMTPTGLARARELFAGEGVCVCALPWDLPGATRRFLAAWQPRAGVLVETELWPNLLAAAAARRVPMLLVSARASQRSTQRYQRWAAQLMQQTVRSFAVIGAQSEADRERFLALGANAANVLVIGNLKFDLPLLEGVHARGAARRTQWATGRALWVAGSTHPGEESICIDAQRTLCRRAAAEQRPAPLLVLAPRRPERFAAAARWLDDQALRWRRCSTLGDVQKGDTPVSDAQVLLLDVMGELLDCYAAADVAFVGGSLVPVGGHNPLEPAVLGKPVLMGPHSFNAPDAAAALEGAGALQRVRSAEELSAALERLLWHPEQALALGAKAREVVVVNRGATARAVALIDALDVIER